jgi:hypothetical protein
VRLLEPWSREHMLLLLVFSIVSALPAVGWWLGQALCWQLCAWVGVAATAASPDKHANFAVTSRASHHAVLSACPHVQACLTLCQ